MKNLSNSLKTFEVIVPIEHATGQRTYHIRAETAEQAKVIYEEGHGECVSEEIEAESLGEPEITEIKP